MRLSPRIYAICEQVHKGETVADIGTDHGYVPMLLVKNNISPSAIMCDISADSLDKARFTFAECGIETDESQFRVGDGLRTLNEAEVDTIIIAGLGGLTIRDLIDDDINKSRSFKRYVFQPRKHSGSLRAYLYSNGFDIESEVLAKEGKFICEIIVAVPSSSIHRELPYHENDIRWSYPSSFEQVDRVMLDKRLDWKLPSIDEEIANLKASKQDRTDLINKLEADKKYLQELQLRSHKFHEEAKLY